MFFSIRELVEQCMQSRNKLMGGLAKCGAEEELLPVELVLSMYLQQGVLNSVNLGKKMKSLMSACCPGSPWPPWGSGAVQ